ncbi:YcxB-like protein [Sinobaca qinghaiensis]|uniref:YcxB-like protein n=1 Tax=Sinobaca qinghaiensis TaxID=342944 RepID=A0A419UWU3_9BACL|nr:YcxB-like protein [Sinobaca qinghaiensis]
MPRSGYVIDEVYCHGQVSKQEFVMYNLFHARKRFLISTASLFLLMWLLFAMLTNSTEMFGDNFPVLGISIFGGLVYVIAVFAFQKSIAKKTYEKDPTERMHITYFISAKEIFLQHEKGRRTFVWDDVYKAHIRKDKYLLYMGPHKALLVPFRFFESDKEKQAFEELMKTELSADQVAWKKKKTSSTSS